MKLKSIDEILTKFREVVHRHRRRYLQKNLRPCPFNCKMAEVGTGHKVLGCEGCGSTNPDRCYDADKFVPILPKEEVARQFREDLRNPEILLRDYRDIVFFMWVLGVPVDKKVDESVLQHVEEHAPAKKTDISPEAKRRIIKANRPPVEGGEDDTAGPVVEKRPGTDQKDGRVLPEGSDEISGNH